MPPPDPKQVSAAIARVPQQATKQIRTVLENARRNNVAALAAACEAELRVRGAVEMTDTDAAAAMRISARVQDLPLVDLVSLAFSEVAPFDYEIPVLRWLLGHPGCSFKEGVRITGRNDLSLIIGHLVYNRFGYFRHRIASATQSDILLERDTSGPSVRYTVRPEVAAGLRAAGVA